MNQIEHRPINRRDTVREPRSRRFLRNSSVPRETPTPKRTEIAERQKISEIEREGLRFHDKIAGIYVPCHYSDAAAAAALMMIAFSEVPAQRSRIVGHLRRRRRRNCLTESLFGRKAISPPSEPCFCLSVCSSGESSVEIKIERTNQSGRAALSGENPEICERFNQRSILDSNAAKKKAQFPTHINELFIRTTQRLLCQVYLVSQVSDGEQAA